MFRAARVILHSSEAELGLQFNPAVDGVARREWAPLQRIRDVEESRSERAAGIRNVDVVEQVAKVRREGQVITAVGTRRHNQRSPSAEQRSATMLPARTARSLSLRPFRLGSEAEGF